MIQLLYLYFTIYDLGQILLKTECTISFCIRTFLGFNKNYRYISNIKTDYYSEVTKVTAFKILNNKFYIFISSIQLEIIEHSEEYLKQLCGKNS